MTKHHLKTFYTRKFSCVNARGIPTAAYQVLPEVVYPPHRVPHPDTLQLDLAGVPPPQLDLARVLPPPPGVDRRMDGWTDTCQNITFLRTTYAVGKNLLQLFVSHSARLHEMYASHFDVTTCPVRNSNLLHLMGK